VENSGHDVTKVFPNPVKDLLSVSGIAKDSKYEIYSLDGKLIKQGTYNSSSKISVNNLSKGTYLIKIGESNLKFIKQ
ncbi:MAG TPA: T9SS type A sorting domain-containing protein, partial [Kaistella sp.]|nr:T9SS type A sorting domain-containing protein [Kaistella sp.]